MLFFVCMTPWLLPDWNSGANHSLELWSGHSGCSAGLQKRFQWQATVGDIKWNVDCCSPEFLDIVVAGLKAGHFIAVRTAVECTTWSRAAHPPIRDTESPWGHDGIFKDEKHPKHTECILANRMVIVAIEIFLLCCTLRIPCSWGNPANSIQWSCREMEPLLPNFCNTVVHFCCYGTPRSRRQSRQAQHDDLHQLRVWAFTCGFLKKVLRGLHPECYPSVRPDCWFLHTGEGIGGCGGLRDPRGVYPFL